MSFWQPEPETPAPSPTRTMRPLSQPVGFPLVRGNAPLAEPAGDFGGAAGSRINDFGFDLLRYLPADGNLCVSPTSIAIDLAMVRAGARGDTATQMDKVLHSFGAPGQEAEIVALMQQLQRQTILAGSGGFEYPEATLDPNAPPLVELDVANQVFSQQGMTLKQAYLDSLSSSFDAGVGLLDFLNDPEAARQTINKWASENTHGRIPEPLQPGDVNEATRIAIANAIYLKAAWAIPFDPVNTKPRAFHTASGATVDVPTMAERGQLYYTSGPGYRAVGLPFGSMGIGMTIVVPDDMAAFTSGMTAAKLAALTGSMGMYDVDLTMPRFSLNTRFDLAGTLAGMGMPTVFSPAANLSGISDEPLMIYKVVHQANIDVLEDGVTAAAVTITLGMGTSGMPPQHVKVQIDKPFLYFLSEQESGTILFMGRVNDPSAR